MPACTVVIPAYNPDPDALNRSLARLLLMPLAKRIVIVDDGSEIPINDQQGPLSAQRVELIRQENRGVSAARNTGLDHAVRYDEHVVLLDADDEPRDGLGRALELLNDLRAVAVVSAREEIDHEGHVTHKPVPDEWAGRTLPKPSDVFRPIALFGASGVVLSKSLLRAGLRFDPALTHAEDRDLLRRAADVGDIAVNPDVALRVTLHDDDAQNLTGAAHDAARARAMRTLVERWHNNESDPHFRASATWLINRIAKRRGSDDAWATMVELHKARRWPIPLKTRLRRLFRPGVS